MFLHVHLNYYFLAPTWEKHIPSDMCSPTWETHITSDMGSPTWETHVTSVDSAGCRHILTSLQRALKFDLPYI